VEVGHVNLCALIRVAPTEVQSPAFGNHSVHLDLLKSKFLNAVDHVVFFITRNKFGRIDESIWQCAFVSKEFERLVPSLAPI
jgi:hypothetical protein